MFLVGRALVRWICTRATECSSVLDLVRAVAMDSCVIKPAPLLALQPGCLHRAETSSARLRQLGMQSTSGQVVERLGYLLGRPTPRLGTPPGIGMGGASITPGKSETRPGGQPQGGEGGFTKLTIRYLVLYSDNRRDYEKFWRLVFGQLFNS